jgi:AraC-like DNA-binding protein
MARPKKEINWEIVEKRMEAGCSGIEIAATLRIEENTFYWRFKEQYGKSFQDYKGNLHSAGDSNIKFTQYMKALSGNVPMLTLLGRERLGQGKEEEIKKSPLEDIIELRHENMILKDLLEKAKGVSDVDKSQAE